MKLEEFQTHDLSEFDLTEEEISMFELLEAFEDDLWNYLLDPESSNLPAAPIEEVRWRIAKDMLSINESNLWDGQVSKQGLEMPISSNLLIIDVKGPSGVGKTGFVISIKKYFRDYHPLVECLSPDEPSYYSKFILQSNPYSFTNKEKMRFLMSVIGIEKPDFFKIYEFLERRVFLNYGRQIDLLSLQILNLLGTIAIFKKIILYSKKNSSTPILAFVERGLFDVFVVTRYLILETNLIKHTLIPDVLWDFSKIYPILNKLEVLSGFGVTHWFLGTTKELAQLGKNTRNRIAGVPENSLLTDSQEYYAYLIKMFEKHGELFFHIFSGTTSWENAMKVAKSELPAMITQICRNAWSSV